MKTSLLLTLALMCATLARADDNAPPRMITTTGSATLFVVPDVTVVTFGIENFDAVLNTAIAENREAAASLVKGVKSLGIDEKNINTDVLEVQIEYAYQNGRIEKANGYRVRRTYTIKLTDTRQLERLVEVGLSSGANQLQGVDFQLSDISKVRDQARRMAVVAAKDKALLMAGELGAKVGKPLNISEAGDGYVMPMRAGRGGGMMAMAKMADASMGGSAPAETLPLGQMAVQASVNVAFELE